MSIKSSENRYGSFIVVIHWISALIILGLLISGFRAGGLEDVEIKAAILRAHVPLGFAILTLTLTRIVWWTLFDKKPTAVSIPVWQQRSSSAVHVLFYVVILGMVASGIGMLVLSGAGPSIFGDTPDGLPDFTAYRPRVPHGIGGRAIAALIVIHAGAAFYHQFGKSNQFLSRMWFESK